MVGKYDKDDLKANLKDDFLENELAFSDGRKNDDAVDMCIICHCLGYDVDDLVDEMANKFDWTRRRYVEAMEHIERVKPYCDKWGDPGTMDAMVYCINY